MLCLLFRQHYNDSYLFLLTVLLTVCMLFYVSFIFMDCLFSFYALCNFHSCNGVRMSHWIKGYLTCHTKFTQHLSHTIRPMIFKNYLTHLGPITVRFHTTENTTWVFSPQMFFSLKTNIKNERETISLQSSMPKDTCVLCVLVRTNIIPEISKFHIIDYKTLQYLSYKQHLIDVHAALKHMHVDMIEMYKIVTIEYDATICLKHSPIVLDYKIMVELELRRYAPVLPFAGLKSYRHYFLADCCWESVTGHSRCRCLKGCFCVELSINPVDFSWLGQCITGGPSSG